MYIVPVGLDSLGCHSRISQAEISEFLSGDVEGEKSTVLENSFGVS